MLRKFYFWLLWLEMRGPIRAARECVLKLRQQLAWLAYRLAGAENWERLRVAASEIDRLDAVIEQLQQELKSKRTFDVPAELAAMQDRHNEKMDQLVTHHKIRLREMDQAVLDMKRQRDALLEQRDMALSLAERQSQKIIDLIGVQIKSAGGFDLEA